MDSERKWIWFDLDDTLHDFTSASGVATNTVLRMLSEKALILLDVVEANYKEVLRIQSQASFTDGRTSHEYRYERFMAAIKTSSLNGDILHEIVSHAVNQYEMIFMAGLKLKPHAVELLRQLVDKCYSLAILTDAPHDAQTRVIKQLGIGTYFDHIFTSGSLGVSKQGGMMQKVLQQLAVRPEFVVMVGDSLERDIIPALNSKLEAFWFNEGLLPNTLSCKEFRSLGAFLNTMEKTNAA